MPDRLDPTDRRKNDIVLLTLHEENKRRLDELTARLEHNEHDGQTRFDKIEERFSKIDRALFDTAGESRLTQILDLMTTLRMNGKALAWVAIVIGGLGTAIGAIWSHIATR